MRRLSYGSYGNLINASAKVGDEFDKDVEQIGSPMVKEALEAQKARDKQTIQNEILAVLDQSRTVREGKVQRIRSLRKTVEKELKQLKAIEAAEKIGTDKGDFRPLLVALGQPVPDFQGESQV